MAIPLGVQLYTLREEVNADFDSVLGQLAKIGFRGVELAGYGNLKTADRVRASIDREGLEIIASHVGIDALETDLKQVVAEQVTLGNTRIVVPWIDDSRRKDAAAWTQLAKTMDELAGKCGEQGLTLAYHNHAFEFEKFGGKSGFDIFFETRVAACQI